MLEEKVNNYGQKQKINNFEYIIKIGDKFLQLRLIETSKFNGGGFGKPMPRAKFVKDPSKIHYAISREDLIKLKEMAMRNNAEKR